MAEVNALRYVDKSSDDPPLYQCTRQHVDVHIEIHTMLSLNNLNG